MRADSVRQFLMHHIFNEDEILFEAESGTFCSEKLDFVVKAPQSKNYESTVQGYYEALETLGGLAVATSAVNNLQINVPIGTIVLPLAFVQKRGIQMEEFIAKGAKEGDQKSIIDKVVKLAHNDIDKLRRGVYVSDGYLHNNGVFGDNVKLFDLGSTTINPWRSQFGMADINYLPKEPMRLKQRLNKRGYVIYTTRGYLLSLGMNEAAKAYESETGLNFVSGQISVDPSVEVPKYLLEIMDSISLKYDNDPPIEFIHDPLKFIEEGYKRQNQIWDIVVDVLIRNKYATLFEETAQQEMDMHWAKDINSRRPVEEYLDV
jgi:hypothetical protein